MSDQTRKATEVKQRYEKKWLAIRGVSAVGLGRINEDIGIIISVEGNADDVKAQIPSYVEGIMTKIQWTGTLRAQ